MPTPRDRTLTAYHEAGHVVAAYVHGHYVDTVTIRHTVDSARTAHTEAVWGTGEPHDEHVIEMYAGHAAARLLDPSLDPFEYGAGSDYDQAAALLPFCEYAQATLEARAATLVASHRPMIEAVAMLLLEEETVSADDLDVVLGAVEEGEDWRMNLTTFRTFRDADG